MVSRIKHKFKISVFKQELSVSHEFTAIFSPNSSAVVLLTKQRPTCDSFGPSLVDVHVQAVASAAALVEEPHVGPSLVVEVVDQLQRIVQKTRVGRLWWEGCFDLSRLGSEELLAERESLGKSLGKSLRQSGESWSKALQLKIGSLTHSTEFNWLISTDIKLTKAIQ